MEINNLEDHDLAELERVAQLPRSITVIGRRWRDRKNGNTYCAGDILIDGEHWQGIPYQWGPKDQYLQEATVQLYHAGMIPGIKEYPTGGTEALWRYCSRKGIAFYYAVCDVTTKAQLGV